MILKVIIGFSKQSYSGHNLALLFGTVLVNMQPNALNIVRPVGIQSITSLSQIQELLCPLISGILFLGLLDSPLQIGTNTLTKIQWDPSADFWKAHYNITLFHILSCNFQSS